MQVREILRNATVLYSFENSSIVTESILSGTPARFVANEFLGDVIAEVELGNGGVVRGDTEQDLIDARESIATGIENYFKSIEIYQDALNSFIKLTQAKAAFEGFVNPITVPIHGSLVSQHRIGLALQILKSQGVRDLLRVTLHFGLRRLSWRFWIGREKKS